MNWTRTGFLLAVVLSTAGCRGSTVLVGNLTAMAVVLVMMWSTLNIDRD
ncbi:MAG: hypothetical protein ABEN55_11485 [Bradymonadaceae bacterium]